MGHGARRWESVFQAVSRIHHSSTGCIRNTDIGTINRLSRIDRRFNIPVNAIVAVAIFNVLFGLLYLGPTVAFNAYISSCTIFLNCSYAGPIIILLVRGRKVITADKPDFPLGHIRGYLINWVAVIFIVVTSVVRRSYNPLLELNARR